MLIRSLTLCCIALFFAYVRHVSIEEWPEDVQVASSSNCTASSHSPPATYCLLTVCTPSTALQDALRGPVGSTLLSPPIEATMAVVIRVGLYVVRSEYKCAVASSDLSSEYKCAVASSGLSSK